MYKINFKIPYRDTDSLTDHLTELGYEGICCFEDEASEILDIKDNEGFNIYALFQVDIYLKDQPDLNALSKHLEGFEIVGEIHTQKVQNEDWLELCYRNFPPQEIPPFLIYGSHNDGLEIPAKMIGVRVNAATAFGSGEHQTTRGCLQLLITSNQTPPKNVLDMGCGSGILGISAYKYFKTKFGHEINIDFVDIEEEAIIVTKRNLLENQIPEGGIIQAGNGFAVIPSEKKYDLIFANILAKPLIDMAADMALHAHQHTEIILSGLLIRQKDEVLQAYQSSGFKQIDVFEIDDWCALKLIKGS